MNEYNQRVKMKWDNMLSEAYELNREFNNNQINTNAPSYVTDNNDKHYRDKYEIEQIKSKKDYEFQQAVKQQMLDDDISQAWDEAYASKPQQDARLKQEEELKLKFEKEAEAKVLKEQEHVKQSRLNAEAQAKQERIKIEKEKVNANKKVALRDTDGTLKNWRSNSIFVSKDKRSPDSKILEKGYGNQYKYNYDKNTLGNFKLDIPSSSEVAMTGLDEVADNVRGAAKSKTKVGAMGVGLNAFFTYQTYKESRREGNGVIKSTAKAGVDFAMGEALGAWMLPYSLAKSLPGAVVSGIEGANKLTRDMNSNKRFTTFSDASFQDTQQLATMRQSGMEMAKMSQYNLQQTLMGNEAQYMHR